MAPVPFIASCLCRQNRINVPTTLPTTAHVCHCTTCRTSHGTLFAMHTDLSQLPFAAENPPATLKIYQPDPTSEAKAFFCNNCGTYMFGTYSYEWEGKKNQGYCVSTGCLDLSPEYEESNPGTKMEDVLTIDSHCVIEDTIDGGAAPWVGNWNIENLPHHRKLGRGGEAPLTEDQTKELFRKHVYPTGRTQILGSCKCGAAGFKVTRENENIRYQTSICACDSCRLSTGTDVVPFTRVPRQHATLALNGQYEEWPVVWNEPNRARFSNLIVYESTPGKIAWGACGTCGARVFYQRYNEVYDGVEVVQPLTALFGTDVEKGVLHLDFLDWVGNKLEPIGLMTDAENAGRTGILSKNMSKIYGEWVETLPSK